MGMDEGKTWLSYAEAAKRVKSSDRTVKRWRREGMPMSWRVDDAGQRYRVVELEVLLAWWRERMAASPVHFYRLRAMAIEQGRTPPPMPARFKRRQGMPATAQNIDSTRDFATQQFSEVSECPEVGLEALERTSTAMAQVFAELPEFIGQAEHAALIRAMEDQPPACDGLEVFTRDRFNDAEEVEMMRGICRSCPLLDPCQAFATAGKPTGGM